MAEISVIQHPSGRWQVGDIRGAYSDRRIRDEHAQHCCNIRKCPFTIEGLNNKDSSAYDRDSMMSRYRFVRRSRKEVERINLTDNTSQIFSDKPIEIDGRMQYIHLEEYLALRVKHPLHRIFGTTDSEEWFGGHHPDRGTEARVDLVWDMIHGRTGMHYRDDVNLRLFPLSIPTKQRCANLRLADLTDNDVEVLRSQMEYFDVGSVLRPRQAYIDIDSLGLPSLLRTKVANPYEVVDFRRDFAWSIDDILDIKGLASPKRALAGPPVMSDASLL